VDQAETLRQALRKQQHARREYQEAKSKKVPPDESPEQWAQRVEDLREAAETAEAEMTQLRPVPSTVDHPTDEAYQPPMGPDLSN
jgi:hypothetical protein